jgi:hypothetical protein
VAWVGDSACFGAAVADGNTAAVRLETLAAECGRAVESINFGVPGYNILQAAVVVEQRVVRFQEVDYVVYLHHENDIANFAGFYTMAFTSFRHFWGYDRPGSFLRRVLRRSQLATLLYVNFVLPRADDDEGQPGGALHVPAGTTRSDVAAMPLTRHTSICLSLYQERSTHYNLFRRDLGRLVAAARRLGARPIVVYFPTLSLNTPQRHHLIADLLRDLCDQLDVPMLDTSDAFGLVPPGELYYDPDHPSAVGHEIIASAVFQEIRRDRWRAPPASIFQSETGLALESSTTAPHPDSAAPGTPTSSLWPGGGPG